MFWRRGLHLIIRLMFPPVFKPAQPRQIEKPAAPWESSLCDRETSASEIRSPRGFNREASDLSTCLETPV
ncbi:hypothetical protein RRG08_046572 [Elysia crispata]|uniref:Uncharacterized protein n=1 Tax=Elysia crispata TaxID=231223 RepID=A0AAE1APB7_9GAST|nr:hypothetical protein RRG08_046572 [Elysia crispata]